MAEQLLAIRRDEVLLAFAFPPYSAQTIEAAAAAKERGASVIGITNETLSPLAAHCKVVLVAKTNSRVPSNSITAPMVLVHGLAAAVAASRPRSSLKAIERAMALRDRKAAGK